MTSIKSLQQQKKQDKPDDAQPSYVPLKYTLMGSFLLLIIPILIAMSVSDYLNAKSDLESAYKTLQQQTESNILNAIKLVNAGHKVLESFLDKDMKNAFVTFIDAYQMARRNPSKMDLEDLKRQIGGKMDLYIINAKGIVEYTTYTKDLGLDFNKWPDVFSFITSVRKGNTYADGGFGTEARTGIVRKFSYMPTPDHKYTLELGLVSNEFAKLMGGLNIAKITARLKTLNSSLNQVRIFSRHGHSLNDSNYKPDSAKAEIIKKVYETKQSVEIADELRKRYTRYLFVNLKDENRSVSSDPSKIIELTYNTRLIDEGLQKTASFHFLLSMISIVLSIIVTFIISAWITRPIQSIVNSVNIIAEGQLEHRIEVVANNELKVLKQSIIKMVNSMLAYINQFELQNNELTKLDKLKDDFLSNTSHELRTPINGIIGIADSMIDGATGKLPTTAVENLSMIVFSGKRLSNLVNDILDFSKLKHKNIVLQIKPIEIKVVVDVVLILSQPLIGSNNIQLINNIEDNPPVDADENRMQQILHNLISNAIKFTDSGTVKIYSAICNNFLMISVSDTGVGIPVDKVDTVFTPFEQGDGSIAREYGGTGLGLSITKQLIELHGGEIQIQSIQGKGTTVSFTLPLSKTLIADYTSDLVTMLNRARDLKPVELKIESEDEELEKINSNIATNKNESFHVLIVDDDPINLQVLENQLRLENYAITRALSGKEALNAVKSGTPFAIILLDIMMPKMSGLEVCKIIRETYPANQLPIIMLTAKHQVSDLVEGMQAGANDYLTKPFSKGELFARIRAHIQLSRVNIAYSNFVPLEFLQLLEKESIIDVRLGDHVQKHMSILFADIRSFTTLSESMSPKENFDFINAYLGRVSPVIRKHNGFIDKYIGDAIMALFPEKVDDAVQASIEIHQQLIAFNKDRKKNLMQPISIGIGLHIGTLMLGTIGEKKRMEGTVISDAVNLASRLEGLTKMYGASLIMSEEILKELTNLEQYHYRSLGKVRVKGKQEPVHIFEIIDSESDEEVKIKKIQLKSLFNQAVGFYYQKQFQQAFIQFQHIMTELPQDKATAFYLERCKHYIEQGIPDNWEGIEALAQK
ncbi:response regulator [Candidatus Parabeggiatoa sp. HSG14]|uniref:response regulator n=1 Tax=Candidatus Parabeggiatoa sp. HSG14 TaxID=3055593 RepID=UPI0025A876EE|nr:ATP-binding protein [Thiotrichales bacterium HSG14]